MTERFVSPAEVLVRRLHRRLWLERVCWLLLVGGLAAWHFGLLSPGRGRTTVLIAANGEPVTVVATQHDADRLIQEAKAATGLPPADVSIAQKLTFHRVAARENPAQHDPEALRQLTAKLSLLTTAYAVAANGETVVAVPDQKAAVKILSLVLQHGSPPGEAAVSFKENVRIEKRQVPVADLQPSADAAAARIAEAAAPKGTYTVRPGNSAWQIARDRNVPLTRLAAANPEVKLEQIRPGIVLNIPGELPPLTVIAVQEVLEPVSAAPFAPLRKVRINYENGVEVSRRTIGHPPTSPTGAPPRRTPSARSNSFSMGAP